MEAIGEFTDNTLDFILAAAPPRSRLYHLAPVGIGTPEVESLTGYISRLSAAHRISVFAFFKHLAFPLIRKSSLFWGRNVLPVGYVRALNGIGVIAKNAVDAVEAMTMRADIGYLTCLPWSNALSLISLFKPRRVWCPCCYEEWRVTGRTVYEPLIWTFKAVELCTRHCKPLRRDCQHCGQGQEWLSQRSRPGHCNKCRGWLGIPVAADSQTCGELPRVTEWEYQRWASDSVGAFLAAAPRLAAKPAKDSCARSLTLCLEKFTRGRAQAFGELLRIDGKQVYRWKRGNVQPMLGTILKLCHLLDVNLVDFLTGSIDAEKLAAAVQSFSTRHPYEYQKKPVRTDRRAIRRKFRRVLRGNKVPPPVTALAKRWNINLSLLYQYFPEMCRAVVERRKAGEEARDEFEREYLKAALKENPPRSLTRIVGATCYKSRIKQIEKKHPELCKAIRNRYRKHQDDLRKKNEYELKREVSRAAIELHRQSIYPSTNKVADLLSVPSRMSSEAARNMLREVQRELGYC